MREQCRRMAVAAQTSFPFSFIAGDTVRVTIGDSKYPSSAWTLQVVLQGATESKPFDVTAGDNNAFDLVISATDSAKIAPGLYQVAYIYTETAQDGDRQTGDCVDSVTVYADPAQTAAKSIARQTLEAMEAAYLKLAGGSNVTVNFNGQSFTKRNLRDLADAIDRQRAIVSGETNSRICGDRRGGRILHPL